MRRCEDERNVKMRRCFTDPHYWKNPALRRSREKMHILGIKWHAKFSLCGVFSAIRVPQKQQTEK